MNRIARASRRRPTLEALEARSLLNASADEVFVKFAATDPAARRSAELATVGGSVVASYPDGPELIALGRGVTPASAVARLQAMPGVAYASPDSTIHVASTPIYPSDPQFGADWGLNQANNIDVDAPEAYGVTAGSPNVIVAVIDTGVDLGSPDLAPRLWTNPANDASLGYPNDVHGWNFVAGTNNVQDDNGHGTHVSAVIAAEANNGYGIVGVAPAVRIMPLKFLDSNGNGSTDGAVAAIYYAVRHGARVINASWGGEQAYGPLADAISYANARNVVFVTASGNGNAQEIGTNNDVYPSYPGSYGLPNELTVASIDQAGNLAGFSNYGPRTVNVAAPGVDVVSEVPTSIDPSGLETLSGTSMSTAYASGVAALVASVDPTFSAAQIVQRIDSTVKILPGLVGKVISGGIVDAYNAVTGDTPTVWTPPVPAAGIPPLVPGEQTRAQVRAVVLGSDEFFAVHGSSAVGFVTGLYESIFDRLPDSTGLIDEVNLYNSDYATRFQMALALLDLPEAKQTEVAGWYQVDLGRTASMAQLKLDPGVDFWASLLSKGLGDNAVRAAILASPEFINAHGASPPFFVEGLYVNLTGRPADNLGLTAWSNLLWAGQSPYNVALAFLDETEVAETEVSIWFLVDLDRPETLDQLKSDPGIAGLAGYVGPF